MEREQPQTHPQPLPAMEATSNIVVDILLSIFTLGIYNLFWQARQFRVLNAFLGARRFDFWQWFLLSIVSCGIYHLYTEYVMGNAIMEIQRNLGRPVSTNVGLLSVVVALFGTTIVADAIQQHEINEFYR